MWTDTVSLLMLVLFLVVYNRLSKPINRQQAEAAKAGRTLENARELQESWDRSLTLRVPMLAISLLAQCLMLLLCLR